MQPTILPIKAERCDWIGVETIIRQFPEFQALDARPLLAEAVEAARIHHPTIILLATVIDGRPTAPLVGHLHVASPTSRIVMIGDALTVDELMATVRGGAIAFMEWAYLNPRTLRLCLAAVIAGLLVGTRGVCPPFLDAADRWRRSRDVGLMLTPDERVVLKRLIEGFDQNEIPSLEHMSEAKVRRVTTSLKHKFGAPSLVALGGSTIQRCT